MLSHHAYYIEDSLAQFDAYKRAIAASEGYDASDAGFVARYFEKFGIEESRALIDLSSLKNTNGKALFFIGIGSITSEAQQALLKLFEEPQEGSVFVLLVPHGTLLPTLKSRFLEYGQKLTAGKSSGEAKEFLSWSYKKRSDWIAALLKDEDDAKEHVRTFFGELEAELYPKIADKEIRAALGELAHFRQYLSDRAPSLKMILEHFAATLPVSK